MENLQQRLPKQFYYLEMAKAAASRSTCLNKHWGAIIVTGDEIIATGYNGAPRGRVNCCDVGTCYRIQMNIPRGTQYERCRSIHAEANAIISASRRDMRNGSMYIYGWDMITNQMVQKPDSCMMCKRMIINAGISEVIFADQAGICKNPIVGYGYRVQKVNTWVEEDDMSVYGGNGY